MERLIKAVHDWNNRDMAIVYIGGEVYEDVTHGVCLQRYYNDHDMNFNVYLGNRPQIQTFIELSEENGGQDVILAHRVDKADSIYFIYGMRNGNEMSDREIKKDLSEIYPNKKIFNDIEHDNNDNHGYDEDEQINKGVDKLRKFEAGELGDALETFEYTLASDNQYYSNGYVLLEMVSNTGFRILTVPIITIKGKKTDGDDVFDNSDAFSVLGNVDEMCDALTDRLSNFGFIANLDMTDLLDDYVIFEKELQGINKTVRINVDEKMHLDLSDFSNDDKMMFEEDGFKDECIINDNDLSQLNSTCEKVINFSTKTDDEFYEELEYFDFGLDEELANNKIKLKTGRLKKKQSL